MGILWGTTGALYRGFLYSDCILMQGEAGSRVVTGYVKYRMVKLHVRATGGEC